MNNITLHDYSEISNYSFKDGEMLFIVDYEVGVYSAFELIGTNIERNYFLGGVSHPDNGGNVYFKGSSPLLAVGENIVGFVLLSELDKVLDHTKRLEE